MRRACALPVMATVLGTVAIGGARAQVFPPPQPSVDERYTAVRDRPHPELEAQGLRLGAFTAYPSLGVAGIYDDNVLATETNKKADGLIRISPELRIASDWPVNALNLRLAARAERYFDLTSENGTDLDAGADGKLEIGRDTELRFVGRWQRDRESRRSQDVFVQTERPVRYSTTSFGVALSHTMSRIKLAGEASVQRFDYQDARLEDGTPIDEDFRDSNLVHLRGRATFAQSPALGWFGQFTYDRREYRTARIGSPARDSDGYEILGGVVFEPAALMRGEIGIGYLTRNYRSPLFGDFSGFAMNGKVELFPTQLTTVTIKAKREANDAGIPQSSGYVTTGGEVTVDHELLRSLILTASASYQTDRFNGVDRKDRRWGARFVADYRMNRNIALRLSYDHLNLDSNGVDRFKSFTDNRVLFGITTRF